MQFYTYKYLSETVVEKLPPKQRERVKECLRRIRALRMENGHAQADPDACWWALKINPANPDVVVVYYPYITDGLGAINTRAALSCGDLICDLDIIRPRNKDMDRKTILCASFSGWLEDTLDSMGLF